MNDVHYEASTFEKRDIRGQPMAIESCPSTFHCPARRYSRTTSYASSRISQNPNPRRHAVPV